MPDQENPPTKIPTSYNSTAKEENPIPKVPTSYDATAKEEPQPPTASDDEGK